MRDSRPSTPAGERPSRASLIDLALTEAKKPVQSGRAWARSLGPTGALVVALGIVFVDFSLAIRPWASLPLTALETLLAIPWVVLVLRVEPGERRLPTSGAGSAVGRVRARLAHFVNIGLLAFALFEKWRLLVRALGAEEAVDSFVPGYRSFAIVALVVAVIGVLARGHRAQRFLADAADHPARLMVLSFGIAAFLGGFLLSLPEAVADVRHASFLDALFTAVSAVCVTGLAVNDVPSTYTFFGEAVILVLAQIGGMGIMVLSASFAVLAGRKLRVKQSAVLVEMIDAGSLAALRRTLLKILGYTLLFEAIGAALLYAFASLHPEVMLGPDDPHPVAGAGDRLWWAVFHAVSAFCNAGFSLSHGSLTGFVASWPICLTISALILLGGIGFPVIDELRVYLWSIARRRRPERVSLHARVALATSAGLVLLVAVAVLALEWGRTMAGMPWHARVLAAIFQSITMRTAGFNSLDFGAMHAATIALACVVMFIGASPGSTGGGIKTTTFAAIFAEFRAELRGQPTARLFDRQLAPGVVRRATGVVFLSIGLVAALTFVLLITEDAPPIALLFEVVSAVATVGLSMGVTGGLSAVGKLAIIVAMFIGRIGPLTIALAMASEAPRAPVELASERVMIG